MAVMAKTLNKPFYVVAESFKFVRMYPLNQGDLPNDEKVLHNPHLWLEQVHALCYYIIGERSEPS